jgi:hypothetical protein
MLHRHLLILQRFTASPFDALIAANAVNATLSRQDPVNVVERLHTYYPAFVGGCSLKSSQGSCGRGVRITNTAKFSEHVQPEPIQASERVRDLDEMRPRDLGSNEVGLKEG